MGVRLAAPVFLFIAFSLQAQDDAGYRRMRQSQQQITEYLQREARRITDRAAAELASPASWEAARARRVEEMRDMLGLLPWPERTPLRTRITGALDKGSYTIEKIAFESLPRIYVTGNLYLPKQRSAPLPAIVYVCGHAISPYGDKTKYQRHGISLAKNGYIAFILDSIQIAETFGLHHGVQSQEMFDWYTRGYTPAGVEVWNAMRAIDYLESRPEVDKNKIGMTGRSGGAAMSWFSAAVDPRVKVVAPVMGISTYAANLQHNTQRLHCDCMFTINTHLHDMLHQGALIAPRPLLMAHGKQDALFPVPGYEEFEKRIGALYTAYGRGAEFTNVVVETGHLDSEFLRAQAIQWFDRHLKAIPPRKLDLDYSDAAEESLAVFSGSPPGDAQNYRVHETFTTAPPPSRHASAASWTARRDQVMASLRTKVFGAFPAAKPDLSQTRASADFEFETEPGITVRALLRRPQLVSGAKAPALLYVASDGEDPRAINESTGAAAAIRLVMYPRGTGVVPWEKSFWKDTLRNAMHTGRSIDSMRVWDVMCALDLLASQPGVDAAQITVAGRGIAGALGLYAAILDSRVSQVLLIDPPTSHAQGPIFLNVMRYTDLPEAAALLAPRRLTFYGYMPPAFEYTRHVYALHGKPEHLFLGMSIPGAVEGRFHHNYSSGR
ncbi:MAG: acetylxylan esterase [Bryobacteraceae bacterium]